MSKRDRDAKRQLDDLFGSGHLPGRADNRPGSDNWAKGRAAKAKEAERQREVEKAAKRQKDLKTERQKHERERRGGKPRRGLF